MKKKLLFILGVILAVISVFFLFEQGIYLFIKPSSKAKALIDMSYEYAVVDKYNYVTIYDDGSIYVTDATGKVISKKWYRIMYTDLARLKKSINDLEGDYEEEYDLKIIAATTEIYVRRRNEKVLIYRKGSVTGKNNSKLSKKIIKILKKYNYLID